MYWKTEVDISSKSYSSGVYQGLVSDSIDADGVAPFVSLGTEYRVNANYALTLEYKYLDAEIDDDGVKATFFGPITGRPYKIYAVYAGAKGISFPSFLLVSIPARLLRFILLTWITWWVDVLFKWFVDCCASTLDIKR